MTRAGEGSFDRVLPRLGGGSAVEIELRERSEEARGGEAPTSVTLRQPVRPSLVSAMRWLTLPQPLSAILLQL
jgi:hypothetical protein